MLEAAAPLLRGAGGRALAPVDLHVTLCFLGAVGEAQLAALRERAGRVTVRAFELEFEGLACWRGARILAATVARVPPAALELVQALVGAAQEVGLAQEPRPWRPHLTLLRGVTAPQLPAGADREAWPALHLTLRATRFYLAESQGFGAQACDAAEAVRAEARRYRLLDCWALRP